MGIDFKFKKIFKVPINFFYLVSQRKFLIRSFVTGMFTQRFYSFIR